MIDFLSEFIEREREWFEAGGKFIVPLPRPYVIEVDQDDLKNKTNWPDKTRKPMIKVVAL